MRNNLEHFNEEHITRKALADKESEEKTAKPAKKTAKKTKKAKDSKE